MNKAAHEPWKIRDWCTRTNGGEQVFHGSTPHSLIRIDVREGKPMYYVQGKGDIVISGDSLLAISKDVAEPEALLIKGGEVCHRDVYCRSTNSAVGQAHAYLFSVRNTGSPVLACDDKTRGSLVLESASDQGLSRLLGS